MTRPFSFPSFPALFPVAVLLLSSVLHGDASDGSSGGNPHVFFLPPLGSQPQAPGRFDGNRSPIVEICDYADTGCLSPPLAVFSDSDGPGSERVRGDLDEEHYIVNWNTRLFPVNPSKTYRIRILIRTEAPDSIAHELAFMDVKIYTHGKPPKDDAYAWIFANSTVPIKFRLEEGFCPICELSETDRSKITPPILAQFLGHDIQEPVDALVNVHDDTLPLPESSGLEIIRDWRPILAKTFVRIFDPITLAALASSPNTKRIHESLHYELTTTALLSPQSSAADNAWLEQLGQQVAQQAGYVGAGVSVVVLDDGGQALQGFSQRLPNGHSIDVSSPAFGPCTGIGMPACCQVIVDENPFPNDPHITKHMTLVAERVAMVGPGISIIAFDVGGEGGIGCSLSGGSICLYEAYAWVLSNRTQHNIVAVNMSFASTERVFDDASCPDYDDDSFQRLQAAGIMPIAGAGNDGHWQARNNRFEGISHPACSPFVVGVGASTAVSTVECYSTRGPNMDLLAFSSNGTSLATPVVSACWAILRAAMPNLSNDEILDRLVSTGVPVEDRDAVCPDVTGGFVFPDVRLAAALGLTDDDYIGDYQESGDGCGQELAVGDFNADGYDDLAIGVPGEHGPAYGWYQNAQPNINPGAVNLVYGGPSGLDLGNEQTLTFSGPRERYSWDPTGDPYWFTGFGAVLCRGDFNGDHHDDLAVSAPGLELVRRNGPIETRPTGVIKTYYGSAQGLIESSTQYWEEYDTVCFSAPAHVTCIPTPRSIGFGSSLAGGDFNNDGFDDLAIGVPAANLPGAPGSGVVYVLRGSAGGLTKMGGYRVIQSGQRLGGAIVAPQTGERFGFSISAADIDEDGSCDLAVGAPRRSLVLDTYSVARAGLVSVFYGRPVLGVQDFPGRRVQFIDKQVLESFDEDQQFGHELAFGKRDQEHPSLFVASIREPNPLCGVDPSTTCKQGVALRYPGGADGLIVTSWLPDHLVYRWNEQADTDRRARFATGPFGLFPEHEYQLVIGLPDAYRGPNRGAGELLWQRLNFGFASQGSPWAREWSEPGDAFAAAIAIGDFDGDGFADLAVGVPGEDSVAMPGGYRDGCEPNSWMDAGMVHVVYGPNEIDPRAQQLRQGVVE